jgi:hypothetical protein
VCDEGVEGLRDVVGIGMGGKGYMERETERGLEMRTCMKMEMKLYTLVARL